MSQMTHTHYIAVDVTKELPKWIHSSDPYNNVYHVQYEDGTKGDVLFNGFSFESTYGKVARWLKPYTDTETVDPGEFAEWTSRNSWFIFEYTENDDAIWENQVTGKQATSKDLLSLYKLDKQKTTAWDNQKE